jgi:hypothetical protein
MTEKIFSAMLKTVLTEPSHPEVRDVKAKWITCPPPPMCGAEWHNNIFEIETTYGNGAVARVTLTRIQAVAVANAILPRGAK